MATDTRLWLLNKLKEVRASLADLIRASVARAEQDVDVLMPGFTHLQPAMTVRWSHWLLGHAAAWQRDDMRLRDLMPRVAMLPLGSGDNVYFFHVLSARAACYMNAMKKHNSDQSKTTVSSLAFIYMAAASICYWLLSHAAAWQQLDMRLRDLMP